MKKILLVFLLILLCSCSVAKHYEFEMSNDKISKIEIVIIDTNEQLEVLKELPADSDIIQDIGNLKFKRPFNDPDLTFSGVGVLVAYFDGSYEVILDNCNAYYQNGKRKLGRESCDRDEFMNVLREYYPELTDHISDYE